MSKGKLWAAKLAELVGLGDRVDSLLARRRVFADALSDCQRQSDSFGAFPHADTQPLNALIAAAEKKAAPATAEALDAAIKHLGDFKAALKKQREAQEKEAKAVEARLAKLPEAQLELAAAEKFLATLEKVCPGVELTTAKIRVIVLDARKLFAAGDGVGCVAKLKELKKLPDEAALRKASAAARAKVQSPDLDRAEAAVRALMGLVAPLPAQPYVDRFRALRARMMGEGQVSDPQVIGELRTFADAAEAELERQRGLEISATNTLKLLTGMEAGLKAKVTDAQQISLMAQLQAARGAHAVKDFGTAVELSASTLKAFQDALKVAEPLAAKWAQRKAEWVPAGEVLKTYNDPAKYSPDVVASARALVGNLHMLAQWETEREWESLLSTLDAMVAGSKTIPAIAKKGADFAPQVTKLRVPLDEALKETKASLENIASILQAEGVDGRAGTAGLRGRLDALAAACEARCASAVDEHSLGIKGMLEQVRLLNVDIDAAGKKSSIDAIKTKVRFDAATTEFRKLRESILPALDELDGTSRAASGALRARLEALASAAAADPAKAALDAAALKKELATVQAQVAKDVDGARNDLKKECDEVGKLIESTWAKVKKDGDKQFAPAFEALRAELATARVLVDSRSAEAGGLARDRLAGMRKRLGAMVPASGSTDSPYGKVMVRKAEFEKQMADEKKQLEADAAKAWAQLQADTAKLTADMFGLAPDAVDKRLDALHKQLDLVRADATIVAGYRQAVVQLKVVVKAKLEMLEGDATAPAYVKRLRKRYEAARDQADLPDKLYQAKTALDSVHHELDEAILHPEKAVAAQKQVLAAEESTRLTKAEYESTLDVLQSRLLPKLEATVAGAGGDADQVAEIRRMIHEAKQAAKGGDHAGALRQLALVRTRMQQVERDPAGPVIGSRNQLPADAAMYREAVTTLVREMEALPGLVKKRVGAVDDAVIQRMEAMVQDARNRFIPGAFDLHANRLNSSKLKKPERRAEREAALVQVRALRTLLASHPTLKKLRTNPIAPLDPAIGVVEQRLTRLESNIRRCVQ
jgi:hypothetical protein